jgi:hypothetical protein
MAVLVGAAAVAIASPIASPGPPKPDDDDDVGVNVASVGKCPVRMALLRCNCPLTDCFTDRLLE